jgi:hypothetical protein
MKNIILLALAAFITLSCSDDDKTSIPPSIEGTYKLTSFRTNQVFDFNNDGTATEDFLIESGGCYANSTVVLSANNSSVVNLGNSGIDYIVPLDTNQFTYVVNCVDPIPAPGEYSQSGNNVIITMNNDPYVFAKSSNTLSVVIPYIIYTPVEQQNGEVLYTTSDATLVFTKQ